MDWLQLVERVLPCHGVEGVCAMCLETLQCRGVRDAIECFAMQAVADKGCCGRRGNEGMTYHPTKHGKPATFY